MPSSCSRAPSSSPRTTRPRATTTCRAAAAAQACQGDRGARQTLEGGSAESHLPHDLCDRLRWSRRQRKAVQLYRELLSETPQAAEIQLSVAHALKTLGRRAEAIDCYRSAAAMRPGYGDAYWSLANLKTYRFTDEEIARMRAHEEAPDTTLGRSIPSVLRARQGAGGSRRLRANRSRYYERGNALKKAEIRYQLENIERNAQLQTSRARRNSLPRGAAGALRVPRRSSSWACRAPARRCSSRSWRRTRRSRARWSCADIPRIVQRAAGP